MSLHRRSGAHATIVLTRVNDPSEFGVAILDENGVITGFQEKPSREEAKSDLVSTGFYILEPDTLDHIENEKWDFAKDLFPRLLKLDKKVSGHLSGAFWVDIGNLPGYLRGVRWVLEKTTRRYDAALGRLPSAPMIDGEAHVSHNAQINGPALIEREVTIEDQAKIQQYCVLKRNAHVSSGTVLNRSVIMERAALGRNCTIMDSVIGQSAILQENVTVKGSIIGPGCVLGDGVEVLSGSRIWPNVRIGARERVSGTVVAPMEKAFYFYTDFGQYTGLLATSIEGFVDALERVPIESIEFHTKRRDYERWTRGVLGSNELADAIENFRRTTVTGEALRSGLTGVTKKWVDEISSRRMDA
jgi:NDP-sugar pyrophosphorylase family protein